MKQLVGVTITLLVAVAACNSTAPEDLGDPLTIAKVSGDRQAATGGDTLPRPLVVQTRGRVSGAPRPDVRVVWRITSGSGGVLSNRTTTTDVRGVAAVTALAPNLEDAPLTVVASPAGSSASVSFSARVTRTASGADSLQKAGGDGQTGPAGKPLDDPYVVKVVDEARAGVAGAEVRFFVQDGGGSLSTSSATSDSAGEARVTATLPEDDNATQRVGATVTSLRDTVVFSSTTVGAPAAIAAVSGDGQSGTGGEQLADPLVVEVTDAAGRRVPEQTVEWEITSASGGSLSASETTTDSLGRTSVTATLPTREGDTMTVAASPTGTADTARFSATVTQAGPVAESIRKVGGDDQKGIVRDTLLDPIEVEVTDASGAAAVDASVKWKVVSGNGGSVRNATTRTDSAGTTENRWRVGDDAGATDSVIAWIEPSGSEPDTVTFTAEVTGTPDTIVVVQGAIEEDNNATPEPETVVGDTVTAAPGFWSRKPFKARVEDVRGDTVRGATLTWTVTSGGGAVGDEPEGDGSTEIKVNTASDGSISVWRKATSDSTVAEPGDWIGVTLSIEDFPDVVAITLDALIRE